MLGYEIGDKKSDPWFYTVKEETVISVGLRYLINRLTGTRHIIVYMWRVLYQVLLKVSIQRNSNSLMFILLVSAVLDRKFQPKVVEEEGKS